jgi:hypothetical protein
MDVLCILPQEKSVVARFFKKVFSIYTTVINVIKGAAMHGRSVFFHGK